LKEEPLSEKPEKTPDVEPLIPQAIEWMKNELNAMLVGNHGVGKTYAVIETARALGLKLKIFSCSTMDPFTDLVGVPFAREGADGREHLKMVRPIEIDEADVIFFDEFNRADAKVHNALFEIIQFRSINGEPLPKLKCCWAAMNPPGADYDVEELDPALIDRFDVFEEVAPKPNAAYLHSTGIKLPVAQALIAWYREQNTDKRELSKTITPRRLEKIGKVWDATGDVAFSIPHWFPCDRSKLREMLQQAEAKAEAEGITSAPGTANTGPTRRFEYSDSYLRKNEFEVAEYLRDNEGDLETHKAVYEVVEPRLAPKLVGDYGAIVSALLPSLREALFSEMPEAKLTRLVEQELPKIDDKREPLVRNLIEEANAAYKGRGLGK
jgi:hypothetical protein